MNQRRCLLFLGQDGAFLMMPAGIGLTQLDCMLLPFCFQKNEWRKFSAPKGVMTPKGRRSHSATVFQDSLYIYGGYQDLKGSSSELWSFHFGNFFFYLKKYYACISYSATRCSWEKVSSCKNFSTFLTSSCLRVNTISLWTVPWHQPSFHLFSSKKKLLTPFSRRKKNISPNFEFTFKSFLIRGGGSRHSKNWLCCDALCFKAEKY